MPMLRHLSHFLVACDEQSLATVSFRQLKIQGLPLPVH
jgi:hypothetical protein